MEYINAHSFHTSNTFSIAIQSSANSDSNYGHKKNIPLKISYYKFVCASFLLVYISQKSNQIKIYFKSTHPIIQNNIIDYNGMLFAVNAICWCVMLMLQTVVCL